jgi:glycosyltransferase involved in cell wall biosynthesis
VIREKSWFARLLKRLVRDGYAHCDLLVDLGSCMRARLDVYRPTCERATLAPWALSEPEAILQPDPATRRELFGAEASLGLLYSGNFGRAHAYDEFLALARTLRDTRIRMTFCARGNRVDELRAAVRADDTNVRFGNFASETQLAQRLGAADIHLVSLRPEWTGVVVPSKFFGCLAAGRPVLFLGGRDSCIARWIEEYDVGWVLGHDNLADIAERLRRFESHPEELTALRERCFKTYREHFCRSSVMSQWDTRLRTLLEPVKRN